MRSSRLVGHPRPSELQLPNGLHRWHLSFHHWMLNGPCLCVKLRLVLNPRMAPCLWTGGRVMVQEEEPTVCPTITATDTWCTSSGCGRSRCLIECPCAGHADSGRPTAQPSCRWQGTHQPCWRDAKHALPGEHGRPLVAPAGRGPSDASAASFARERAELLHFRRLTPAEKPKELATLGCARGEVLLHHLPAPVDTQETPLYMYCTGGIRCEFMGAALRQRGDWAEFLIQSSFPFSVMEEFRRFLK
eukprot:g17484.t1